MTESWTELHVERDALRRKVEELETRQEGLVCGDCIDGSGWQENAVEGRYPCTCMTEAEPYQLLQEQLAACQKERDDLREIVKYITDEKTKDLIDYLRNDKNAAAFIR